MTGRKPVWLKEELHGLLKARGVHTGKPLIEVADEVVLAGFDGHTGGLSLTEQEGRLVLALLETGRRKGDTSTLVWSTVASRLSQYLSGKLAPGVAKAKMFKGER